MKAFVINLDRNTERLAFMQEQFKRLGMDVERFRAIDGRGLSSEELRRHHAKVRSYIAFQRKMEPPKVAVALSHSGVYQTIIDRKLPYALVLEDDVRLGDGFHEALRRAERFVDPTRPQVITFNGYGVDDAATCAPEIREVSRMWCADAYIITHPAAERIRHANYPVLTSADSFRRYHRRHGVELYRVVPTTARQDDRFPTENRQSPKAPWFIRLPLKGLDWILWKLTGR